MTPEQQENLKKTLAYYGKDPMNVDRLVPPLRRHVLHTPTGPQLLHPWVHQPFFISWKLANKVYEWKAARARLARAAGDWDTWVSIHERPYRLRALAHLWRRRTITREQLRSLLAWVWPDAEPAYELGWHYLFVAAGYTGEPLPTDAEPLTVYRGQPSLARRWQGHAWSLQRATAEFFAARYTGRGVVLTAAVHSSNVRAYLTSRGEAEVIAHPRHVQVLRYEPYVNPKQADGAYGAMYRQYQQTR